MKLVPVRITTLDDALAGLGKTQRGNDAVEAITEEVARVYAASGKALAEQIVADWPEIAEAAARRRP